MEIAGADPFGVTLARPVVILHTVHAEGRATLEGEHYFLPTDD